MNLVKKFRYSFFLFSLWFASPAFAQLEKVNTLMESVESALTAVAVVVVTVAVLVAGYKIIFQGQTFREVAPIVVGGIIIGAASQIASMLVGS